MKKTITYREITIAIGILVAMVVALTLWTRVPAENLSGGNTGRRISLPSAAEYLAGATARWFSFEGKASVDQP